MKKAYFLAICVSVLGFLFQATSRSEEAVSGSLTEAESALLFLSQVAKEGLKGGEPTKIELPQGFENWSIPWRTVVLARVDIARGDFETARNRLQEFLLAHPVHPAANYAKGYLGEIDAFEGRERDAVQTLKPLIGQIEMPSVAMEFRYILARAMKNIDPEGALAVVEHGLISSPSPEAREGWQLLAVEIIDDGFDFIDARRIYEERGRGYIFNEILMLKLARIYLHINELEAAAKITREYAALYPSGRLMGEFKIVADYLRGLTEVEPNTFGVILPLKGRHGEYGMKALQAMRLALVPVDKIKEENRALSRARENLRKAKSEKGDVEAAARELEALEISDGFTIESKHWKFIFRDNGADPSATPRIVDELVRKDKVVAILGPLFSQTSLNAAFKAEELGVPLMTLSRREGLPEIGGNIFRNCLTSKAQAYTLADFMINRMKMKRFAALVPEHSYGLEMADLFWDAVEKYGGEIRGYETYEQDATQFSNPVKRLVGRYYVEARGDYWSIRNELKDLTGLQRKRTLDRLLRNMPPVIDFDAIFIPDYYQTVSLVAPAIQFEDVILYTESRWHIDRIRKATGRIDLKMVRLLGGSGWNSPRLIERAEQHVQHSIFVDGFYPNSEEPGTIKFMATYKSIKPNDPDIVEAQAYESAAMFAALAEKERFESRGAFRLALRGVKEFPGATGRLSVDANGEVTKELYVLTIIGQKIRLMEEVLEEKEKGAQPKAK